MTTLKHIRESVGWPVSELVVTHRCTDPHVWVCSFVFEYYTQPKIVAGMGDTRSEAIEDAIRCAESRKH